VSDIDDFEREVIERSRQKPVVVDFFAGWCGACSILGPQLEVVRERHRGEWVLVKINIDKHPALAMMCKVTSVPAVRLFINGKITAEFAGAQPAHLIEQWLKENLPHP
jgi:putative thioredoxin